MAARSTDTRVMRVVLTLTLFVLMLCQGAPVLAQEGTGGAPPEVVDEALGNTGGVPPTSIIYNLYATDAYIPLADGRAVYNYGFVGGRAGPTQLTFQNSVIPTGNRDPVTGQWSSYDYNGITTLSTAATTKVRRAIPQSPFGNYAATGVRLSMVWIEAR